MVNDNQGMSLWTRHQEAKAPNMKSNSDEAAVPARVTARAFLLGIVGTAALAWLNCWVENVANAHFLGGTQLPCGAVFGLLLLVLFVNGPLKFLGRQQGLGKFFPPLSAAELLTIYAMLLFAALISAPGTDNFFITTGPALFYFATPENRWAETFYRYIPTWFAPGWNGRTFQTQVIRPLYEGGLSYNQIPWHAWAMMLIGWSVFLLLVYATLFFLALLLRRQWIENESLTFPLVQLPLQMIESGHDSHPSARAFWSNQTMWAGVALAGVLHFLRGMNNYYPDWPAINAFQGSGVPLIFPDRPWNVMGGFSAEIFLGAIGIAFLLTREVSFSFWAFYLLFKLEMVVAEQLGFAVASQPKDTFLGRPTFMTFQSIGGWAGMAVFLLWTARGHLGVMAREAWSGQNSPKVLDGEPFSPRFIVLGFVFCLAGVLAWSQFAGISLWVATAFLGIYLISSLVLARLVIEGGFLYPQVSFSPMEWMTTGLFGAGTIGAANLTKLAFIGPMMMSDMRANVLPGFLHTLKIAHETKMAPSAVRRLVGSVAVAVVVALAVTIGTSIVTLYDKGGLTTYKWFAQGGPRLAFTGAAATLDSQPPVSSLNIFWALIGMGLVLILTLARSRFLWFPFHPLGYIMASSYPITKLWLSFFLGWSIKSLVMKYGGNDAVIRLRPFMLGLILGNAAAMVIWMVVGFFKGSQIPYWPA